MPTDSKLAGQEVRPANQLTKEAVDELRTVCEPVVEWLNKYADPHQKIEITSTWCELTIGSVAIHCDKFVKD